MASRARCSFIMGPLGSGKTFGAIQRMLLHMQEQAPNAQGVRPTRWFVVRNTYSDLETTTMKDFQAIFKDGELGRMKGSKPPNYKALFRLEDGTTVEAEVIFLALDREEDVRKLRGAQGTGFWLNEVKELEKAIVNMADARHGRYPSMGDGGVMPTWHGLLGDTNAPDEDHWYFHAAEVTREPGWEFFRQPGGVVPVIDPHTHEPIEGKWELNPAAENLQNLVPDYYQALLANKEPDWISVMLSNEYGFTIDGKPVHPEFRDSIHTAREAISYNPSWPLIIGIDFGRTPAAAITQRDPVLDRRFVIDEIVTEDMAASQFGPMLKRHLEQNYPECWNTGVQIWGDPAGDNLGDAIDSSAMAILRSAGIPCQPTTSNAPPVRRAALANVINRNAMDQRSAFLLSPKCSVLRKGLMGGFCYRRIKVPGSERYTEHPDKNHFSHIVEALEYAFQGDGEGRAAVRRAQSEGGHRGQPTAVM